MTLKLISIIAVAAVSNWAMAFEVVNSDSLCQMQRESLGNIAKSLPKDIQCLKKIDSAAKCCAGDGRPECSTVGIPMQASVGGNAAADLTMRSNTAMVQLIDQNVQRCNAKAEEVNCSGNEIEAMKTYSKAQAKLTDCLLVMRRGYESDAQQASLTYGASGAERMPASNSTSDDYRNMIKPAIATDSDVADRNIQKVDWESDQKKPVNLQILGQHDMVEMPFDKAKAVQRFLKEGGTRSYIMGK